MLAESWKCDFIKILATLFCFHGESYLLPLLYWWLACLLLLYFHHDCHYTFLRVKRLLLCGLTTLLPIVQYYRQSLGHIYHNHLRLTIPRKECNTTRYLLIQFPMLNYSLSWIWVQKYERLLSSFLNGHKVPTLLVPCFSINQSKFY